MDRVGGVHPQRAQVGSRAVARHALLVLLAQPEP